MNRVLISQALIALAVALAFLAGLGVMIHQELKPGAVFPRIVTLWCNEEGWLIKMRPTVQVNGQAIAGPWFITAVDEEGETVPLTDDEAARVRYGFGGSIYPELNTIALDLIYDPEQ